jgi:hypothetical protein
MSGTTTLRALIVQGSDQTFIRVAMLAMLIFEAAILRTKQCQSGETIQ